jgi:AraC-like DNA-binding protein
MAADRLRHEALRRLADALRRRQPEDVLAAGLLAAAALRAETKDGSGPLLAAALLSGLLLDAGADLDESIRCRLERGAAEVAGASDQDTVGRCLETLWDELARLVGSPAVTQRPAAAAVAELLAGRLDHRATLGEIAQAAGCSPGHVSTLVRRLTGRRFTALRRDLRLVRARQLLAAGVAVKVAALEAGFSDPAYFARVFRRAHGVAPSRWRGRPHRGRRPWRRPAGFGLTGGACRSDEHGRSAAD